MAWRFAGDSLGNGKFNILNLNQEFVYMCFFIVSFIFSGAAFSAFSAEFFLYGIILFAFLGFLFFWEIRKALRYKYSVAWTVFAGVLGLVLSGILHLFVGDYYDSVEAETKRETTAEISNETLGAGTDFRGNAD